MITQEYYLDIVPGGVPVMCHASQYDTGRTLRFHLHKSGVPVVLVGGDGVQVTGTKPDHFGFAYDVAVTVGNDYADVPITEQMCAVDGITRCQLVLTNSAGVVGSAVFNLAVQKAALGNDTVVSDSDIPAIHDAQRYAAEAKEAAQAVPAVSARVDNIEGRVENLESKGDAIPVSALMPINVTLLGIPSDGSEDVTEKLKNAIRTYRAVYLPAGTYYVSDLKIPVKDRMIVGDYGLTEIVSDLSKDEQLVRLEGGITLKNLVINGNARDENGAIRSGYSYTKPALFVTGDGNKIIDCIIKNGFAFNVQIQGATNTLVSGCEITTNAGDASGLNISGDADGYNVIRNCSSHDNQLDGFVVNQPHNMLDHCNSYNNGQAYYSGGNRAAGVYIQLKADFTEVAHCNIHHNTGLGIEFAGDAVNYAGDFVTDCKIISNSIIECGGFAIDMRNGSRHIITGNYIKKCNTAQYGASAQVRFVKGGSDAFNLIFDNNLIDADSATRFGIWVAGTNCFNISGSNICINHREGGNDNEVHYDGLTNKITNLDSRKHLRNGGLINIGKKGFTETSNIQYALDGDIFVTNTSIRVFSNGAWHSINFSS